jgi:hypothetical protein
MCTFRDDHSVMVCDTGIDYVRAALAAESDCDVRFKVHHGEGTLVEAAPEVDGSRFEDVVRRALQQVP